MKMNYESWRKTCKGIDKQLQQWLPALTR